MDIAQLLHIRYDCHIQSNPKEILTNENYNKIVRNILDDQLNYFLSAEVGYGKTTGIIELAANRKKKILLMLPLKANVMEFKEYCKSRGIRVGVIRSLPKGSSNKQRAGRDQEIKKIVKDDEIYIYLSVYDNINVVMKSVDLFVFKYKYNLVIDEAHNIVTSYRYRAKAIEDMLKHSPNFRKTILISGTPEGTIDNNSDYKKIHFSFSQENIIKRKLEELEIIKYESGKLKKLLHHVINNKVEGKVIILINNRREIKKFSLMLKQQLINENAEGVFVLSSDHKNEELFLEIIKSKYIPENVKYLITTSVIAEGMNILNNNIDSIYMLEIDDWWLKRQFIGRFRRGVNCIYDFMNYKFEYPQMWIDPVLMRKDLLKCAQLIAEAKNEINKLGFSKIFSDEENQIIHLDKENNVEKWSTGEFKVNHSLIDINVIEKLNRIMALDPERAKEFYNSVAGYKNVVIVEYEKEIEKYCFNVKNYQVSNSVVEDELTKNFLNLLNTHIYIKKPTIYASKSFDRSIIDGSIDPLEFKSQYYSLLGAESFLPNLFDYLIDLFSKDYPIGYLNYLFNLKLEKPNINIKNEIKFFNNLLIRDIGKMNSDKKKLFQGSKRHKKFNILWELNKELENKDYIEVSELKEIYSQICKKYDLDKANIQEAYDIVNSIFISGKLQCRYQKKNKSQKDKPYFYVKPIGVPKTYRSLYSINQNDLSRYEYKLQNFINESLKDLSFETSHFPLIVN